MFSPGASQLLSALARRAGREKAAARLAQALGAEHLLLLVLDEELDAFLPALGMPQTLPGGASWRELLRRARTPGTHAAKLRFSGRSSDHGAVAISTPEGLLLVLIGGAPAFPDLDQLPLLAALLRAEMEVESAQGRERSAREQARHTATLASVLDATRSELERTLDESRRLNLELQGAARTKDEFLAMLAHELRNPLAPIVSALELVTRQGPGAPSSVRLFEVMQRQVRQLTRLVDDLLDVSRISRNLIKLRAETLPLQQQLAQAIESVRPIITAEQHEVSVRAPEAPLWVSADPVRLTQILANLLHNAAKYTPRGGRIEVEMLAKEGLARLCVRDNGIGIEADILPRIFDLFTQAPRALDRAKGGLGIGLTVVERLVKLHRGTISARSEGRGKGSEFELQLPLVDAPRELPEVEAATHSRSPARRILVIDDNRDAAELLGEVLREHGFQVREAHDGESGLALARDCSPDVALIDIGLPGMDGYTVAARLRELVPHATQIALSGYGDEEHRTRSRLAGIDAHLVKPVDFEDLFRLLRDLPAPASRG